MLFKPLSAALLVPFIVTAKYYCLDLIPSEKLKQCIQVDWPTPTEKSIEIQFTVMCNMYGSEGNPMTYNQTSPHAFEVSDKSKEDFAHYIEDIQEICGGVMRVNDDDLRKVYDMNDELILTFGGARKLTPCSCS